MRKLLVIIVVYLTLILSTVPVRAKCDGGETIQGVANHHSYCKSTTGMTWWAAFAWCKYQGRELATMLEACPNTYGAIGNGACPNLMVDKNEVIWTADPSGTTHAVRVNLSSGLVTNPHANGKGRNDTTPYALCY